MIKQKIKKILELTSFLLFTIFLLSLDSTKRVNADTEYNCTYHGGAEAKCLDMESVGGEFALDYYTCNGQGGCNTTKNTYSVYCTFLGYEPGTGAHRCLQSPTPPVGYSPYDRCTAKCKCSYDYTPAGPCYNDSTCQLVDGLYKCLGPGVPDSRGWECLDNTCCQTNGSGCTGAHCDKTSDCGVPTNQYYMCNQKEVCPKSTDGESIGVAICCGKGGGGGDDDDQCIPKCPDENNRCTVTDNCPHVNKIDDPNEYLFYRMTETGGSLCKGKDAYCVDPNGCGGYKVCNTASCYKPETNTSIPKVNRAQIFEDLRINIPDQPGKTFYWSTPSTIPTGETLIRYPHPNSTTATEVDNIGLPTGARGLRARLRIKGTTVSNETEVSGSPKELGRDNPFYAFRNIPDKGWSWFNYGYSAYFSATFETQNKCDDSWIPGQSSKLHFKVNTPPVLTSTAITGNTTQTTKGCTPENRYTGNEANRKLTFKIAARDVDVKGSNPNHKINAAVIWLVKEGHSLGEEINNIRSLGPRDTHVALDPNKIGLIVYTTGTHVGLFRYYPTDGWVRKNGGTAQDQQSIYINDNGNKVKVAELKAARIGHSGNTTSMEIDIEFEKNSPISGKYTLWAGMMDNLTLFEAQPYGIFTDQRSVKRTAETWNFDFVNPKLQDISLKPKSPEDQRRLDLKWNSTDNIPNGIRPNHTVVNVYKTGTTPAHPVIRETPSPQQTVQNPHSGEQIPPQDDIGKMQSVTNGMPNSGWFHPNAGQTEMTANIGTNSEGKIHFYITTYDRACNYEQTGKDGTPGINPVELNKWITTKGGIFYSQGTVDYPTEDLGQKYNLGTELISSKKYGLDTVLNYPNTNMNPAVAKGITDVNNNPGLFDKLNESFEYIRPSLGIAKLEGTIFNPVYACNNPNGCILTLNYGDSIGGFRYRGKIILIPREGQENLNIDRSIQQIDNNSAFFVFAKGDIDIGYRGGSSSDGSTLETDQIDAFLIAKGNINILPEAPEGGFHDKVLVNGGIIALGEVGSSPAFSLQRTLGLLNPNHPVLTANYHPKYAVFSELFFGLQTNAYKREVGFKPM